MAKTGLIAIILISSILLFADFVCGFSGGNTNRRARLPFFTSKDDIVVESPSGGAGSWRFKAKEFQENPTTSFGGKRLNIAFVVSYCPKM